MPTPQPPDDAVRCIALTKGKFAIVDAANYDWLSWHKWTASCKGAKCDACRKDKGRHVLMHRAIMQVPDGLVVDHINRNGLDNRRRNLRICTQAQNSWNAGPRAGTSKFKGVCLHKAAGKYMAEITCDGKPEHIGLFDDEIEAAIAHDLRAIAAFGRFAYLNFPHIIKATTQARRLLAQETSDGGSE